MNINYLIPTSKYVRAVENPVGLYVRNHRCLCVCLSYLIILPHLPVSPSCLWTLLEEALETLHSSVQLCCHLLSLFLQPPSVLLHPLQQVSQSQREHPQLGHRDFTCLLRCGRVTWWRGSVGLAQSHQQNGETQHLAHPHPPGFDQVETESPFWVCRVGP